MNIVETFERNGFTVKIVVDEDCESPRRWDNFATLVCWHDNARLGDVQRNRHSADCSAKAIVREVRAKGDRVVAILPLYLYQHSGMTMRCEPFGCRFDSGQVGWGYVTASQAEKMGCKPGAKWKHGDKSGRYDKAYFEEIIRQEVAVYDDYIRGECFGFVVEDEDGDELASCWGFVGDLDYVRKEATDAADSAEPLGKVAGGCDARCEA